MLRNLFIFFLPGLLFFSDFFGSNLLFIPFKLLILVVAFLADAACDQKDAIFYSTLTTNCLLLVCLFVRFDSSNLIVRCSSHSNLLYRSSSRLFAKAAILIYIYIIAVLTVYVVANPLLKFGLPDNYFFFWGIKNILFFETNFRTSGAGFCLLPLCFVYCSTVPTFPIFLLVIDWSILWASSYVLYIMLFIWHFRRLILRKVRRDWFFENWRLCW